MEVHSNSKYTILIIDDVPENIQVVSSILYQKGVNIAIAQSGGEALKIISRKSPDLILLDIIMPEMDGFAVCEHLQHDPATKEIPIIFLTAKNQPDDIVKGFNLGAVDYVTKPFNPAELLSRVFTHLELKKSRDLISAQNQQLAERNLKLQELNATKDKFFSIIAHDLKNPFSTLITLSSLLKDELRKYTLDEIEKFTRLIYDASERSYNLLENLLAWSRSQTGNIPFHPEKFSLKKIVGDTVKMLGSSAKNKHINLYSEISEDIVAFADVKMIATTIRNLLSNAIKFTEDGGEVKITAKDMEEWVEITVSDTGVGIKEEDLKKLFRIDVHHSTSGTAQEKGTGLGLILCKEFVEKHGGKIGVESEVGKGSHFTFMLPKVKSV
jgi:signal transduction histidine kinase